MAAVPLILVVDDDAAIRRLVRTGLELEGFAVIEAATLAHARSVDTERVDGIVLDRQLPDGDGIEAFDDLQERYPDALVVLHSATRVPDDYRSVPKGDIDGLVSCFGLAEPPPVERAPDVARASAERIVEDWVELCRWDPELPADNRPPIAGSVVGAVASALERPQPVGWGLDPALEPVAETYLLNHDDALDVAVAQLVCLREAFERRVVDGLPPAEQLEAARRLTMIIQRLMTVVVRTGVAELHAQVLTDPVTGLGNLRAFAADLRQERTRAACHGRPLTVVRLAMQGMDAALGDDAALQQVGGVLAALRGEHVHAYHLGLAQFALLLPDALAVDARFVLGPLAEARRGAVAVGVATYPQDPLDELEQHVERRLREDSGAGPLPWSERVRQTGGPDL